MKITNEMLQAAITRAIELGVLPRRSHPEDIAINTELMHEVLQAALDKTSGQNDDDGTGTNHRGRR